jgi:hypothetical protein
LTHGVDRIKNNLHITDAGRDLRKRYDTMMARIEDEFFGALPADERRNFLSALQTLFGG